MNIHGRKLGHIVTEETKRKISIAQKGRLRTSIKKNCLICNKVFVALLSRIKIGKGRFCSRICYQKFEHGENNPTWKGDKISYSGLHNWIRDQLGTPKLCEFCGTTSANIFEWANKSHQYKRDLEDWIRLCRSCHYKYDRT